MSERKTFDDFESTKNVLAKKKSKAGRPKTGEPVKKKAVHCYLTEEEHEEFVAFLDGRPASGFLRSVVLGLLKGK
jgi:hypothetical protein